MPSHWPERRFHLFELHDLAWFPAVFRSALTEWLRALWEYSEAADVVTPLLRKSLAISGAARLVDLCSGRSGPVIPVQNRLESAGVFLPVVITDKFPDHTALIRLRDQSGGRITVSLEPVDATSLPGDLLGFRTLFNAFHHFRPADARRILADAYRSRQPIGIFEITERRLSKVLLCFPASFLSVFLLIWKMYPHRMAWWIFTWLIPVIPITIAWDGLVSHLRTYTPAEMEQLIEGLRDETFRWETGRVAAPRAGLDVSYLIGVPVDPPGL
ncbi:MAG TPA: hypothetical protein VHZ74_23495 [Bryobacteraceae bacterium]|jgi:hypothetical protein|nr:hypothetical protein [Bryobacteraceae bacterium]